MSGHFWYISFCTVLSDTRAGKSSDFPLQTPYVRPKSAVYTQKRDDEHCRHFYIWELPSPGQNSPFSKQRDKVKVTLRVHFLLFFKVAFSLLRLQIALILRTRSLSFIHRIFGFLHGCFCFCLWEKLNKQTNRLTWILSLIETLWSVPVPSSLPRIFTYNQPQKIANAFTRTTESFLKHDWDKMCTEQQKVLTSSTTAFSKLLYFFMAALPVLSSM